MTTACFRIVSVVLLLVALSGCQSPGSFASLFGKKEDPGAADGLAANGSRGGRERGNWDANRNNGSFGNHGVEDELRVARRASVERRYLAARSSYEKVLQMQPGNIEAHQGLAVVCD